MKASDVFQKCCQNMSPLDFFLQSATKIGGFKFLPSIGGVQIKSEDNLLLTLFLVLEILMKHTFLYFDISLITYTVKQNVVIGLII